jgi:hypothetical protein
VARLAPGSIAAQHPRLAFGGGEYLLAWEQGSMQVRGARLSATGELIDAPAGFLVGDGGSLQAATWDGGAFVVARLPDAPRLARIGADGTVVTAPSIEYASAMDLAGGGGESLLVWESHGQIYDAPISGAGKVGRVQSITSGQLFGCSMAGAAGGAPLLPALVVIVVLACVRARRRASL